MVLSIVAQDLIETHDPGEETRIKYKIETVDPLESKNWIYAIKR